jgi:excisionase family DNA binding protein
MNPKNFQMIIKWSEEDQAYLGEVPELAGCMADGATRHEAIASAEIVIQESLETVQDLRRLIPQSQTTLLSITEVAERLGLSEPMVHRYCAEGRLPAKKDGNGWVVRRWNVERFAARPR